MARILGLSRPLGSAPHQRRWQSSHTPPARQQTRADQLGYTSPMSGHSCGASYSSARPRSGKPGPESAAAWPWGWWWAPHCRTDRISLTRPQPGRRWWSWQSGGRDGRDGRRKGWRHQSSPRGVSPSQIYSRVRVPVFSAMMWPKWSQTKCVVAAGEVATLMRSFWNPS